MNYYSLKGRSPEVSFREAALQGQAPDGGLYFPRSIAPLSTSWLDSFKALSKPQIAFDVIYPFVGNTIPDAELFRICEETLAFDIPLKSISSRISSLELYHGPTLAFKDVGARFMSRCLSFFLKDKGRKATVLVATSGDTGGAVANGFRDADGIDVVILYPSGKVSHIQELQLTTSGSNVKALEVEGSFDDCQALVKQAFLDEELNRRMFLTSANSINVARWLPQQFYYFLGLQAWNENTAPVISVPSGNFGNLCSGVLAHLRGLPVKHFVAACNSNKVFTEFMTSQQYRPAAAVSTISNAMDIGDPSNFVRILELFDHKFSPMQTLISSYSISDELTAQTIQKVLHSFGYLLEPHGAVAYHALEQYLELHRDEKGLILETAHPVKFAETVQRITGRSVEIPDSVKNLHALDKKSLLIKPIYSELKAYLLRT